MKVLFIVTAYPRRTGDVITPWLVELIRRLKAEGVEVEVLAPAYRGLKSQQVEGVRVHRFRYAPRGWETLTHDQTAPDRIRERPWYLGLVPAYLVAGSAAAARLARSGEFDVVHAFWPLPHGLMGLAAKRASGLPLVSTFFGVELTWMESQLPFLKPTLRRIARGSDAVTVISTYTAAKLRRSVPDVRPAVIPFGGTVAPRAEVAPPLSGGPEVPIHLLFVGRLVERKGVHRLIEALASLPTPPAARLTVVGEGPERDRLESLVSRFGVGSLVRFTGGIPGDALAREFEAADALVLPAVPDQKGDVEGLGVVLIEALAYGRPVIGSAVGGIPDIVRDRETGLLVEPDNAAALAAAITWIDTNREEARRMGARGREDVMERFGWPRVVTDLIGVYRAVRGGISRRPRTTRAISSTR